MSIQPKIGCDIEEQMYSNLTILSSTVHRYLTQVRMWSGMTPCSSFRNFLLLTFIDKISDYLKFLGGHCDRCPISTWAKAVNVEDLLSKKQIYDKLCWFDQYWQRFGLTFKPSVFAKEANIYNIFDPRYKMTSFVKTLFWNWAKFTIFWLGKTFLGCTCSLQEDEPDMTNAFRLRLHQHYSGHMSFSSMYLRIV